MKKILIFICLILGIKANAQFEASISLDAGYIKDGYLGRLSYTQVINRNGSVKIQGNLIYLNTKESYQKIDVPFQGISFGLNYLQRILKPNKRENKISLFAGGGGFLGYETFDNQFNQLETGAITETNNQIIYGINGIGELSYKIGQSSKTNLLLVAKHYYKFKSSYGQNRSYIGVGVRYLLFEN